MSGTSIKAPAASNSSLDSILDYSGNPKIQVKFDGSFLKQEKLTFTRNTILNFYIVYEIIIWPLDLDSKFVLLIYFWCC